MNVCCLRSHFFGIALLVQAEAIQFSFTVHYHINAYINQVLFCFSLIKQKKSGLKKNGDKNEETAFVRRRGPTDAIIPAGLDKEDWSSLFYHMDFCGTLISHNKKNLSQSCLPLYQISFFYLVITLL